MYLFVAFMGCTVRAIHPEGANKVEPRSKDLSSGSSCAGRRFFGVFRRGISSR